MRTYVMLAVCLAMATSMAQAQPLVTDGLTFYYSFDDVNEDGFFMDGSGNELDGLITLGFEDANEDELPDIRLETEDTVRGSGAVLFDTDPEVEEDYVAVCDPAGDYVEACDRAVDNFLVPETGFTIAAWVKAEETGDDQSIWQSRASGGGFIHTQVQGNGGVRMRLRGDTNQDNIVEFNELPGGTPVPFDEWFHYAGTYQKNEGDDFGEWAFYVNGEEVAAGEANGNVAGTEFEVLGDWGQGAFLGLVPDFNRQFVGLMDEVYLFHRGIGPEEVLTLFEMPPLGPEGDFDGDGEIGPGDLDAMAQLVKDGDLAADVNEDGTVDMTDRSAWIHDIQGSWVGDANFDGEFNSSDLVFTFTAGKYETGEMATYAEGDFDGNMMFDSGDFVFAFSDGGYEQGPFQAAVAAVPEPSSLVLAMMGLLGLVLRRRKV